MTSPDKEATLEHVRGLACCRFQWDDSSKAWDLYYHADPELEHEVAERAWDQEFTLALVTLGRPSSALLDTSMTLISASTDHTHSAAKLISLYSQHGCVALCSGLLAFTE